MNSKFADGSEAVAALPDCARIGPFNFKIEKWASKDANSVNRYGECDSYQLVIRIRCDIPSELKVLDTFTHECLHAMYMASGLAHDAKEEDVCGQLGRAFTGFYLDNPWFLSWVERCCG